MNTTLFAFNALAVEIPVIIFIVLFVGGLIAWRIVKAVRAKKNGGACGGCSACSARGSCPHAKRKPTTDDGAMPEATVLSEATCDFSDLIKPIDKR